MVGGLLLGGIPMPSWLGGGFDKSTPGSGRVFVYPFGGGADGSSPGWIFDFSGDLRGGRNGDGNSVKARPDGRADGRHPRSAFDGGICSLSSVVHSLDSPRFGLRVSVCSAGGILLGISRSVRHHALRVRFGSGGVLCGELPLVQLCKRG